MQGLYSLSGRTSYRKISTDDSRHKGPVIRKIFPYHDIVIEASFMP